MNTDRVLPLFEYVRRNELKCEFCGYGHKLLLIYGYKNGGKKGYNKPREARIYCKRCSMFVGVYHNKTHIKYDTKSAVALFYSADELKERRDKLSKQADGIRLAQRRRQ